MRYCLFKRLYKLKFIDSNCTSNCIKIFSQNALIRVYRRPCFTLVCCLHGPKLSAKGLRVIFATYGDSFLHWMLFFTYICRFFMMLQPGAKQTCMFVLQNKMLYLLRALDKYLRFLFTNTRYTSNIACACIVLFVYRARMNLSLFPVS